VEDEAGPALPARPAQSATPIPLSAPSVVPGASTQPSRTTALIGIVFEVMLRPALAWHTISRCPCRITPGLPSLPGLAGFFRIRLPAASTMDSMPRVCAQAMRCRAVPLPDTKVAGFRTEWAKLRPHRARLQVFKNIGLCHKNSLLFVEISYEP